MKDRGGYVYYWYRIVTEDGSDEPYTYLGASTQTINVLAKKAARGEYIQLTDLLYSDRGRIKEWTEWDTNIKPTVFINPAHIYSIMQLKGDPRVKSGKKL